MPSLSSEETTKPFQNIVKNRKISPHSDNAYTGHEFTYNKNNKYNFLPSVVDGVSRSHIFFVSDDVDCSPCLLPKKCDKINQGHSSVEVSKYRKRGEQSHASVGKSSTLRKRKLNEKKTECIYQKPKKQIKKENLYGEYVSLSLMYKFFFVSYLGKLLV